MRIIAAPACSTARPVPLRVPVDNIVPPNAFFRGPVEAPRIATRGASRLPQDLQNILWDPGDPDRNSCSQPLPARSGLVHKCLRGLTVFVWHSGCPYHVLRMKADLAIEHGRLGQERLS